MTERNYVYPDPDADYEIPNEDDINPVDIHSGIGLSGRDLGDANLSGSDLRHADLSGADLRRADLSGAHLRGADLSDTYLRDTDLSEASLDGADLSGAYLRDTTFAEVTLSRGTKIDSPGKRIEQELKDDDSVSKQERKDVIARLHGELRAAYSANGLTQARTARIRERRARRREAKAEKGWRGTTAWFGSLLSRIFAGYGVQLTPVIGWMLVLYLVSASVYWHWGEMAWDRSLYYSVVTFTTAPPKTPPSGASSYIAGFETFAGTVAIVFLGYVLGSRERI